MGFAVVVSCVAGNTCAYCEAVKRRQRVVTGATSVVFGNSTTHVLVLRLDRAGLVSLVGFFTSRPSFGARFYKDYIF